MVIKCAHKNNFWVIFHISLVGTQWAGKPGALKKQSRSIKLRFRLLKRFNEWFSQPSCCNDFPRQKQIWKSAFCSALSYLCEQCFTIRSPSKHAGGMRLILAGRSQWYNLLIVNKGTEAEYSRFETNMAKVNKEEFVQPPKAFQTSDSACELCIHSHCFRFIRVAK